ncbi:MAG: hypothetical protein ACK5LE_04220 [Alphaproteobacteria bacterium]
MSENLDLESWQKQQNKGKTSQTLYEPKKNKQQSDNQRKKTF